MLSVCKYRLCVLNIAIIGILLLTIPFFGHFASEGGLASDVLKSGLWALITALIIGRFALHILKENKYVRIKLYIESY